MSLVRFKFYGNGHTKPFTGYIAIRLEGEEGKWVLSSNSLRQRELTTLEGQGMHEGGKIFVEEMHHFIAYWAVAQADAIEKHRVWTGHKSPQQKLVRPGFRAVTAAKQWHSYVADTKREVALIEQDVKNAYRALHEGMWTAKIDETPFPFFIYGDPWQLLSPPTPTHDQPKPSTNG